jgi:Protein of unknown function (DUF1572)
MVEINYLDSAINQFEYYKKIAEKTIEQITDEQLFWQYNSESNSIANIVKHLTGNMLSRWTDFLTTDGEKTWRNRDDEFINDISTKLELMSYWNKGWNCFFDTINKLEPDDLKKIIYIRNQEHTVIEAINRQLTHYPYRVGQIVFIGKMICNNQWKSLSIPKGNSVIFNNEKFSNSEVNKHFRNNL